MLTLKLIVKTLSVNFTFCSRQLFSTLQYQVSQTKCNFSLLSRYKLKLILLATHHTLPQQADIYGKLFESPKQNKQVMPQTRSIYLPITVNL